MNALPIRLWDRWWGKNMGVVYLWYKKCKKKSHSFNILFVKHSFLGEIQIKKNKITFQFFSSKEKAPFQTCFSFLLSKSFMDHQGSCVINWIRIRKYVGTYSFFFKNQTINSKGISLYFLKTKHTLNAERSLSTNCSLNAGARVSASSMN